MPSSEKFPEYPALACCLLVDSRLSTRQELEKDLKSNALFLEIKVAQSLASAKLAMELEDMDACVLGAAVSPAAVKELLLWAPANARSKDCAFVIVAEAGAPPLDAAPESAAHSIVYKPLTKAKLFDALVRAVIAANKDSPWKGIFENSAFHRTFDTENPLLAPAAKRSVNHDALKNPELSLGMTALDPTDTEAISQIFKEKNLVFSADGTPSPELRLAALNLLGSLFPNGMPENERFAKHCTKAVYGWFENAPLGGFKEASEQLRMTILQFRG